MRVKHDGRLLIENHLSDRHLSEAKCCRHNLYSSLSTKCHSANCFSTKRRGTDYRGNKHMGRRENENIRYLLKWKIYIEYFKRRMRLIQMRKGKMKSRKGKRQKYK
jgi:hypothetical protein